MKHYLMALILLAINISSSAAELVFFSDKKRVEIKKQGSAGEGLFEDGTFIRFYPIVSRSDLKLLIQDIEKYPADSKELDRIKKLLTKRFEEKLNPATSEELIRTSLALGKVAEEALAPRDEIECNQENGLKTPVATKETKEEKIYCECELPEDANFEYGLASAPTFEGEYWDDYSILGKIESSSLLINTSNDNHLHGLWRKMAGPEYDGNDRGRTFGLNLDYTLKGSEGEFRLNYESVIFTQLAETAPGSNRFYVNDEGAYRQDLLERNRLDMSLRRNIDNDGVYYIAGVELEELSDEGRVGGPLQEAWHKAFKKAGNIQYDNQDHMDDEINLTLYGGLGKTWMKDIGNWKCTSTIEGTIGYNILDSEDAYFKTRGSLEINSNEFLGRTKESPFFLLTLWAEGSLETKGGNQTGAGVNLSFPREVGKWQIAPQIGFSVKDEKEDRFFSQQQSIKIEPESHIGITFTRKF